MSDVILRCEGVSVVARKKVLIESVGLNLRRGESCAIIGPNGAGKSTLIKAILGLTSMKSGKVIIDGSDAASMSREERARAVAYVPQMLAADIPYSVREFVGMGRYAFHGTSSNQAVDRAMELSGVTQFENRTVSTLSGGERQRVCIAAALAQEAPLLVLDEPLVHLDPGQKMVIKDLIAAISNEVSILAVTHDLDWAGEGFDSLFVMKSGSTIYAGEAEPFYNGERINQLFDIPVNRGKEGNEVG